MNRWPGPTCSHRGRPWATASPTSLRPDPARLNLPCTPSSSRPRTARRGGRGPSRAPRTVTRKPIATAPASAARPPRTSGPADAVEAGRGGADADPGDIVIEDLASAEGLSTDVQSADEPTTEPLTDQALTDEPDAGEDAPLAETDSEHPHASYVLHVNGTDRPVTDAWIGESLLYVLRERLGLAGAKDGCSQGECGACNVQVDGRLVASCLVPAATAAGSEVRTVEGLAVDGEPSDVQRALAELRRRAVRLLHPRAWR